MNQEKNTKTIYGALHIKEKAFKMHYNELHQDVIEWDNNKVVIGENVIWFNGQIVDDVYDIVNVIKVGA